MAGNTKNGGGWRWSRWRIAAWTIAALLLLLPLFAMQFTDEVDWTVFDFLFMGVLLGGVGIALELAVRKTRNAVYRTAAGVALAATILLIWINGAVGIIGSEQEDANLLYGGVLAVALIGAIMARFRPAGMAPAMSSTALAQALVPVIASTFWPESKALVWSPEVPALTGFFAAMWLISAWLFRKAAREQVPMGAAPPTRR
jgi:hypothetical protein